MKSMARGMAMADAAVLVIDAQIGAFEHGISRFGWTRSSALLAYCFGVKKFVVVVNKMDLVGWKEERFEEIKREVVRYLEKVGVKKENIAVLPISAYLSENITKPSPHLSWYKGWEREEAGGGTVRGTTMLDAMDGVTVPVRRVDLPLRVPVQRVHDLACGTVVTGKVVQGVVELGKTYVLQPQGRKVVARSIEVYNRRRKEGRTGDLIGVCLGGIGVYEVWAGSVLCEVDSFAAGAGAPSSSSGGGKKLSKKKETKKDTKPLSANTLTIQIIGTNIVSSILPGRQGMMHIHAACVPYKVLSVTPTDKKTGQTIEGRKGVKTGDGGLLIVQLTKPAYVEAFKDCPALGRFALVEGLGVEAVGIVKEVKDWNGLSSGKGRGVGKGSSSFFR